MLHPKVIAAHAAKLESRLHLTLREHTAAEVTEWCARLQSAFVEGRGSGLKRARKQVRPWTAEEVAFVRNELVLSKVSYPYWASRYCRINRDGQSLGPLYPLLESQSFLLSRMAEVELQAFTGERQDGVLVYVLKSARQVGVSTFAESLICHRSVLQNHLQGLIASHVEGEEGSGYLFGIYERMVQHLPLWMRPTVLSHQKDQDIEFEGGTHVWVGSGRSMTGTVGQRGQLGRGKTLPLQHLSELSTWEYPAQIDSALLPATPRTWRTFAVYESTAKGRNNWWHNKWKLARRGVGRFVPIFIPWYVESGKYSLRPPADWSPKPSTLAHARKCEETSHSWCGRTVRLTRGQLYWYEVTRETYEAEDDLSTFLEEFGSADDEECFQFVGTSIFPAAVLQRIEDNMRPLMAVAEVGPRMGQA